MHHISVMRKLPILLIAATGLTLQAAGHVQATSGAGDCGTVPEPRHPHKSNRFKVFQHLDDKLGNSAIKVSSVGIPRPEAACKPVFTAPKRLETASIQAEPKRVEPAQPAEE